MAHKRTSEPVQSEAMREREVDEWYTAGQAAQKLSETSGRTVGNAYPYKISALGKVRTKKLGDHIRLYCKSDIDGYVVQPRGTKSGMAKRVGIDPGQPTVRAQRKQAKKQEQA